MSLFSRFSQQKSSFQFEVQFHEVTELYTEDEEGEYYCACERNGKKYRTRAVHAVPKKTLGTIADEEEAAAGMGGVMQRRHSEFPSSEFDPSSSPSSSSPSSPTVGQLKHSSLTFTPGKGGTPAGEKAAKVGRMMAEGGAMAAPPLPSPPPLKSSVLTFDETLRFGCTLYKSDGAISYSKKVFRFRLKTVEGKGKQGWGRNKAGKKMDLYTDVNLAAFASKAVRHAILTFPLEGKPSPPPNKPPPQLRCTITCVWVHDTTKDKDGYSSCSSQHSHRGGGGGQNQFSRNRSSNGGRSEMSVLSQYHPRTTSGWDALPPASSHSREASRTSHPVAFYGTDGANVWEAQQPGTATIYDGFPVREAAWENGGGMTAPGSPMQGNGTMLMNGVNAHAASNARDAALSVIRASSNSSRTHSRVHSRNHSLAGGHQAEWDMEIELRQRRRDMEETQYLPPVEQKEGGNEGATPSSPPFHLMRRPLSRTSGFEEKSNSSSSDDFARAYRPHSASVPLAPHPTLRQYSSQNPPPDAADDYAELASIDVLGGLGNGRGNEEAAVGVDHNSILATFRHAPGAPQATAQVPRRPSIIQEEPQIHPHSSFSTMLGGGSNHPLFVGLPVQRTPQSKMQALEDARSRAPPKAPGSAGNSRRPTMAPMSVGSTGASTGGLLNLASLRTSPKLPPTQVNTGASPASSPYAQGRTTPVSGGVQAGLPALILPASAPSLSASNSSVSISSIGAAPQDDWLSSIRNDLVAAPLQLNPSSILLTQRAPSTSSDASSSPAPDAEVAAAPRASLIFPAASLPITDVRSQSADPVPSSSSDPPLFQRNATTPSRPTRLHSGLSLAELPVELGGRVDLSGGVAASPIRPSPPPPSSSPVQQICTISFEVLRNLTLWREGHSGKCWKGEVSRSLFGNGQQGALDASDSLSVIIKVPHHRPGPGEVAELFSFLTLPRSPHVLPFLGLVADWRDPSLPLRPSEQMFCVVTELQRCTLQELARGMTPWTEIGEEEEGEQEAGGGKKDPMLLLQLLHQMALGLSHLHSHRRVHRDLALRNFLLSQENRVLLCDFGLVKQVDEQTSGGGRDSISSLSSSPHLPLRWLAPESLLSHRFTFASDVFSFGVACWELVTQTNKVPYWEVENMREVVSLVCTGEMKLSFSGKCTKQLEKILKRCLSVTPSKRPDVKEVARQIEKLMEKQHGISVPSTDLAPTPSVPLPSPVASPTMALSSSDASRGLGARRASAASGVSTPNFHSEEEEEERDSDDTEDADSD
jgi:hypothetical protein